MLSFRLSCILVLGFFYCIDGQRRIKDGIDVEEDKEYMVYIVQARSAIRHYDSWICGGSIISRWHVLTSAACVEDVQSMYAISATKRYISVSQIFNNTCTEATKNKIIFTCVPKEYELDFSKIENWSFNDIAVVKVERPFDTRKELYLEKCGYIPTDISVNFDVNNEKVGTDVIVVGYGHNRLWRLADNDEDWNNPVMQYASTKIYNIKSCQKVYNSPNLFNNIEKYMICTNGSGSINETGMPLNKIRRTHHEPNLKLGSTRKNNNLPFNQNTRKQGICQNDHGGPLVAWINGTETVIGVASVFRVDKNQTCVGPYLFTSTARNQMFIECVMFDQVSRRSNKICNKPARERGFSIVRRYVLWNENENYIFDNEEIRLRPQINMNLIGMG